jgi:hypothetical protein
MIDQHIRGYTEVLDQFEWSLTLNCAPAGPWTVGVLDDPVPTRADTAGTVLAAAVSPTSTGLPVTTTVGPRWVTTTAYPAEFPFDATVGGEQVTVNAITGVAEDAFARALSSSWGTADSGQAWTTNGGSASDYAVASGTGRHVMSTVNVFRHTTVPVTTPDVDLRVDFLLSAVPVGDSAYVFPMLRYADTTHFYFARVQIAPGGAMTLTLRKRNGAETQLGSAYITGFTYTASAWYTVRIAMAGSTLNGKVWLRGSPEPDWQLSTTDTDLTAAASVGVRTLLGATASNAPITTEFDNLYADPQQMTVVRSVNGIVKSQPAGADVRLARPAFVAL